MMYYNDESRSFQRLSSFKHVSERIQVVGTGRRRRRLCWLKQQEQNHHHRQHSDEYSAKLHPHVEAPSLEMLQHIPAPPIVIDLRNNQQPHGQPRAKRKNSDSQRSRSTQSRHSRKPHSDGKRHIKHIQQHKHPIAVEAPVGGAPRRLAHPPEPVEDREMLFPLETCHILHKINHIKSRTGSPRS